MVHSLRSVVLSEDPRLVLGAHIRWLTTICNFRSLASMGTLVHVASMHKDTDHELIKKKSKFGKETSFLFQAKRKNDNSYSYWESEEVTCTSWVKEVSVL